MVKLSKTVLPEKVFIKSKDDYQTGVVFKTLCRDCFGKCYIYEHKPIPPVVEHIVAHKGDLALEFDWDNMLLACAYCNNVKNKRAFDEGIMNPVKIDPEDFISFELSFDGLKENVVINAKNCFEDAMLLDKTIKLLDMVYNNSSGRDNQRTSSANLKNKLSLNLRYFHLLIDNYKTERDSGNYDNILDEISRGSEFAAFKRMIIRCDPELFNVFEGALL